MLRRHCPSYLLAKWRHVCYILYNERMPDRSHPTDLDDDGKPFDEDAYFAKMGFTKAERKESDKWQLLRDRFRSGHIAHDGQSILETRSANDWMQQTDEPANLPENSLAIFGSRASYVFSSPTPQKGRASWPSRSRNRSLAAAR